MNELARITLKLLQFRAGPQDFPYSINHTRLVAIAALVASFLQYRLTLPMLAAAVHALVFLVVMAGFTWQILSWNKLANRAQQTVNSLFAVDAALTLLLVPLLSLIAPQLIRIAENPDRAASEALPALPLFGVLILWSWRLAVWANVYRHALNMPPIVGAAVAPLVALVSVSVAGTVSSLVLD